MPAPRPPYLLPSRLPPDPLFPSRLDGPLSDGQARAVPPASWRCPGLLPCSSRSAPLLAAPAAALWAHAPLLPAPADRGSASCEVGHSLSWGSPGFRGNSQLRWAWCPARWWWCQPSPWPAVPLVAAPCLERPSVALPGVCGKHSGQERGSSMSRMPGTAPARGVVSHQMVSEAPQRMPRAQQGHPPGLRPWAAGGHKCCPDSGQGWPAGGRWGSHVSSSLSPWEVGLPGRGSLLPALGPRPREGGTEQGSGLSLRPEWVWPWPLRAGRSSQVAGTIPELCPGLNKALPQRGALEPQPPCQGDPNLGHSPEPAAWVGWRPPLSEVSNPHCARPGWSPVPDWPCEPQVEAKGGEGSCPHTHQLPLCGSTP